MTGLVRARTYLAGSETRGTLPEEPVRIVRVDPRHGTAGVFRDAPVVVSFSHPLDASSLHCETLRVEEAGRSLPGRWKLSPDGSVAMWIAADLLNPGAEHVIVASGLRDRHGRVVPPHESRFVPGDLSFEDLPE